jgi:hypothetical protein
MQIRKWFIALGLIGLLAAPIAATELTGLSETDASNTTISSVSTAEGMAPSAVNDALRAIMGAMTRSYNRLIGKYASTGSSNAYVLTPSVALPAYVTGERYSFRANFSNTGAATLNISSLGAKTIKKYTASGKADLAADDIRSGQPVTVEYDGTDLVMVTPVANTLTSLVTADLPSGAVAQVVKTQTGALVAIGTTNIPADDTIPQNSEGGEAFTVSITPTNTNSTLKIDVVVNGGYGVTGQVTAALFQDSTAGALAAGFSRSSAADGPLQIVFTHYMTAGTTSATTFKVRIGGTAGSNFTLNGVAGGRLFGGVMASSITVTEILP